MEEPSWAVFFLILSIDANHHCAHNYQDPQVCGSKICALQPVAHPAGKNRQRSGKSAQMIEPFFYFLHCTGPTHQALSSRRNIFCSRLTQLRYAEESMGQS